ALLENPSVPDEKLAKLSVSASQETIGIMLKSKRVQAAKNILKVLVSNPYAKKEEVAEINRLLGGAIVPPAQSAPGTASAGIAVAAASASTAAASATAEAPQSDESSESAEGEVPDEAVSAYLAEHASEITAEGEKPFQAIGG